MNYFDILIQKVGIANYLIGLTLLLIIVIILLIILVTKKNKEGFAVTSRIDSEALENIVSLYNGKKLIVKDLQVTGRADITGDGLWMNDKPIYFRGGNDKEHYIKWDRSVDGPSLRGYQGVGIVNKATIGNLVIDQLHGQDYGSISHKNKNTKQDYGFLMHKDGNTYLNSGPNSTIYLRHNNETFYQKNKFSTNGNLGNIGNVTANNLIAKNITTDNITAKNDANIAGKSFNGHSHSYSRNKYAAIHSGNEGAATSGVR